MSEAPAVKCPECRELVEPAPRCPRCRFSLRKLDLQFGVAPRHFGLFSDLTRRTTRADERKLTALLELFRRRFPQSALSAFITESPRGSSIGDYALWLANRVRFSEIEAVGELNFDLVLALDTRSGSAALTAGYGLETYVAEEDLAAALETGRAAFVEEDWSAGIEQVVSALTERLRKISGRARVAPSRS